MLSKTMLECEIQEINNTKKGENDHILKIKRIFLT